MRRITKTTSSHWGAFEVTTDGKTIQSIQPFQQDRAPSDIIRITPKAVHHNSRVSRPAFRTSWLKGDRTSRHQASREFFTEVPWDEALDIAAFEIDRIRNEHGNASIFGGSYGWASAGRFHHAQGQLKRFLNCTGGFVAGSGSYSAGSSYVMIPHLFGVDHDEFTWKWQNTWTDIATHCETLVAFGGINPKNSQVNAGGIGDHQTAARLAQIIHNGGSVITVSPQKTDGPANGKWLPLPPGTDVALMAGLAYVLETENLVNHDFISRYTFGYDRLRDYLLGCNGEPAKTPAWAEQYCTIPADKIVQLAREMASSRTLITVAWALQRAQHGEQTYWMATALASMLGQIGEPGRGIGFGYGAVAGVGTDTALLPGPRFPQGKNRIKTSIPVARIADMLLHPGERYNFNGQTLSYPDIRLVYWAGGNPFHHHQDLNRLVRAWSKPDTVIVNEPWWTSTAQHADIVFPATTSFEREDIGYDKTDPYLFHMPPVIEPVDEARNDHDIFRGLSERLGVLEDFTEGLTEREWIEKIYDEFRLSCSRADVEVPLWEELCAQNWVKMNVQGHHHQSGLKKFRTDPITYPLSTPSGRIEIFSQTIASFGYENLPGHPVWTQVADGDKVQFPLLLVSPQPSDKLHSQFEAALADEEGARPMPVFMHPDAASQRKIRDDELVEVYNLRGVCIAKARLTEDLHPSVLSLSTGAWFQLDDQGRDKQGNPNVLTRDIGTSPLAQGSTAHTTYVGVRKVMDA